MSYILYEKPYRSPVELIGEMKKKGLEFICEQHAIGFLQTINYYRFKIYLKPLLDREGFSYEKGATFEKGVELYRFDEALRSLLFSIIGRIEIKLRTRLDQVVTSYRDDPFWYLDNEVFRRNIDRIRSELANAFRRSRDDFAIHFKKKYVNNRHFDYKELPPFWALAELTSFGIIRSLYNSIDKTCFKGKKGINKLDSLATEFGAKNLTILNSWIDLMREVRNRCAHHARVWNCNYREPGDIKNQLGEEYKPSHSNRIYLFVAVLHKMEKALNLDVGVKKQFSDLLQEYPTAQDKITSAGFPDSWLNDPFWK